MADSTSTQPQPAAGEARYQSLYRRFRPQRFSELRGQDLVARTLRSAVRESRVAHAYLFSGPRGTGKTSTARILAKALNCENLEEGEPCGRCESCAAIAAGASFDVLELDAASNNGVDAMRDLVARAALSTPGRRKVYIIDEVHMLTAAASNALLKTLEEPPDHVVFVLATTDPQKVLPTIRSRTQHFEFRLFEGKVLEKLLSEVAGMAGAEVAEETIRAAARRGRGSARDALSALDQAIAAGEVDDYTPYLPSLVAAIAEDDVAAGLRAVGDAVAHGAEPQRLAVELVEALREQFLAGVARRALEPGSDLLAEGAAAVLAPARCTRALEVVGKAVVDMRDAIDPRITLEVALARLTDPALDDSTTALLDRVERLERRLEQMGAAGGQGPGAMRAESSSGQSPPAGSGSAGATSAAGEKGARPALGAFAGARETVPGAGGEGALPGEGEPAPAQDPPPAVREQAEEPTPPTARPGAEPSRQPTRDDLVTAWADDILERLKPRARAVYAVGRWISVEGGVATLALPNAAHVEHAEPLRQDVAEAVGGHFKVKLELELVTEAAARVGAGGEVRSAGDGGGLPAREAEDAPLAPDEETGALSSSSEPHDPVAWAEQRLRQVFPGAEEVTG